MPESIITQTVSHSCSTHAITCLECNARLQDLAQLIDAAEAARVYFAHLVAGNGLNGPTDAVTIGRDLTEALHRIDPPADGADDGIFDFFVDVTRQYARQGER